MLQPLHRQVESVNMTNSCRIYVQPLNASGLVREFAANIDFSNLSTAGTNALGTTRIGSEVLCAPAHCQLQVTSQPIWADNVVAAPTDVALPRDIQPGEPYCVGYAVAAGGWISHR